MSKVLVSDTKLVAIADAIRDKTGDEDSLSLDEMATTIAGLPEGLTAEDLTFSGNLLQFNDNGNLDRIFNKNSSLLTFSNVTNLQSAFRYSNYTGPLNIELTGGEITLSYFCNGATRSTPPTFTVKQGGGLLGSNRMGLTSGSYFMANMDNLETIPDNFFSNFSWSGNNKPAGSMVFVGLRKLSTYPSSFTNLNHNTVSWSGSFNSPYYNNFTNLFSMLALPDLPVPVFTNSGMFSNSFLNLPLVNKITFKGQNLNPNAPITMGWKNQTIDLSQKVGYYSQGNTNQMINGTNLTTDKALFQTGNESLEQILDRYNLLKNETIWFAAASANFQIDGQNVNKALAFSRYNHDSAVETINSLPDTTQNATPGNIIKFTAKAGYYTDGGAIENLTPEEIAVATAKGWTVTLV